MRMLQKFRYRCTELRQKTLRYIRARIVHILTILVREVGLRASGNASAQTHSKPRADLRTRSSAALP